VLTGAGVAKIKKIASVAEVMASYNVSAAYMTRGNGVKNYPPTSVVLIMGL